MINPFAEYRLYISNLAVFYFLSLLLTVISEKIQAPKKISYGLAAGLLGLVALVTFQSNTVWGNGYEVYQRSASVYPGYEKSLTFAGVGCELEQNLECAEIFYSRAISLISRSGDPSAKSMFRLSSIQMKMEKFDKALNTLEMIPVDKLQKVPSQYYKRKLYLLVRLNQKDRFSETLKSVEGKYPDGTFRDQVNFAAETFGN